VLHRPVEKLEAWFEVNKAKFMWFVDQEWGHLVLSKKCSTVLSNKYCKYHDIVLPKRCMLRNLPAIVVLRPEGVTSDCWKESFIGSCLSS
jgi:hypothetical protein